MKKKINRQLIVISALAVLITLLCVVFAFYKLFTRQVMEDLKTYAHVFSSMDLLQEIQYDPASDNIRTTIITPEGKVLYDSLADIGGMDNHSERPEIKEAFKKGEGSSIRRSSTMKMNTYYYTLLLADGSVLRIAREAHSIWSIFYNALPFIIITILVLILVCVVLSHYLTESLVAPIEQMAADMDHIAQVNAYDELVPFAETIQKQHDAILRNAHMRQEFTANVSHELKTPLAAISGYSELIENGMASGEDVVRFAAEIHKNANRLLVLINDIIKLSELDVLDHEIPLEKLDLYEIAKDSVSILQIRAEERSVILTMEGKNCNILGDRQMIEELLYNLCDNAICYNNIGGSVQINVDIVDGCPTLQVKDTGIGIPKEHQDRIFERFYRVDKSRSKSTGGTGLGLAIVKHIVSVHHAEMTLSSEEGRGTDVKVVFMPVQN